MTVTPQKQVADKVTRDSGWDEYGTFAASEVAILIRQMIQSFGQHAPLFYPDIITSIWSEIADNLEFGIDRD